MILQAYRRPVRIIAATAGPRERRSAGCHHRIAPQAILTQRRFRFCLVTSAPPDNLARAFLLERFDEFLTLEQGASARTNEAYARDLARLAVWAASKGVRDPHLVPVPAPGRFVSRSATLLGCVTEDPVPELRVYRVEIASTVCR